MNKKTTIHGMMIWVDFRDDEERLENPVLIYTQTFNDLLGLRDDEWSCFEVPHRSSTNGASWNPFISLLLWLHKRDPKVRLAALGHDFMYRVAGTKIKFYKFDRKEKIKLDKIANKELTRDQVDVFIKEKSKDLGANLYQRNMIYLGLRIGGGKSWKRYFKFNTK